MIILIVIAIMDNMVDMVIMEIMIIMKVELFSTLVVHPKGPRYEIVVALKFGLKKYFIAAEVSN